MMFVLLMAVETTAFSINGKMSSSGNDAVALQLQIGNMERNLSVKRRKMDFYSSSRVGSDDSAVILQIQDQVSHGNVLLTSLDYSRKKGGAKSLPFMQYAATYVGSYVNVKSTIAQTIDGESGLHIGRIVIKPVTSSVVQAAVQYISWRTPKEEREVVGSVEP